MGQRSTSFKQYTRRIVRSTLSVGIANGCVANFASDAVHAPRRYFQIASKERALSQTGQGKAAKIVEERSEDPRTWKQGLITGNMVLRDEVRRIEL